MANMMPLVVLLRVQSEILAVTATSQRFVTIPAGVVIQTSGDLTEPGLHHITYQGQDLLAFTRDIRERTRVISTVPAH